MKTNNFKNAGQTIMHLQALGRNSHYRSRSDLTREDELHETHKMLGNRSKDAKTWINGPTHEIRNQCLPGYTGFIPSVKAENVFSNTYAYNTARSFTNTIYKGHIGSP